MQPKVIVITGASDGIGAAAARQLKRQGHFVVIVGHSPKKTQAVAGELGVPSYFADFTKLRDVRDLAAALQQDYPRIDVLANNAGGIFGKREITFDGHEKTFQVNHLAPFLLTNLLMSNLIASRATIINTSSIANKRYGNLDINDLELEHNYSPNHAYGNGKLANILFTRELHRRFHSHGINAAAFHPGIVATGFARNTTSPMRYVYHTALNKFMSSPEQGAEQLVWLANTEPNVDWQPGIYYEKHKPGRMNPQALDVDLAQRLWERSVQMLQG